MAVDPSTREPPLLPPRTVGGYFCACASWFCFGVVLNGTPRFYLFSIR